MAIRKRNPETGTKVPPAFIDAEQEEQRRKRAQRERFMIRGGIGAGVVALIAIIAIVAFVLGKNSNPAVASPTPSNPAPATTAQAAPAVQQPAVVPSRVLKFENTVVLYEAVATGRVPVGAVVEVRGILDPTAENYIDPTVVGITNSTDRLEIAGGSFTDCRPALGQSHNVRGLKPNAHITVRGEVQSAQPGHASPSTAYLINCIIVK